MATNLLKQGYSVTVYNRSEEKALALKTFGADVVQSPAEVARTVDVLFTMVSDDKALEKIYYGEDGVISGIKPGLVIFDCSTVSPELSRQLHTDLAGYYVEFLDAPVSGSLPAAIDRKLMFIVGGKKDILEEHRDILLAMGAGYRHMGQAGTGSLTKLAINTIVGINTAGFIEGLAIASKLEINLEAFTDLVLSGGAYSKMADLKSQRVLGRDFSTQFALKHMLKDLQLAERQMTAVQFPTPMLQAMENLYRIGFTKGLGDLDLSSIVQIYEEWGSGMISKEAPKSDTPAKVSPGSNRRRDIRIPLGIDLQISIYQWEKEGSFSGQSMAASLSDLSESGMQIICDKPLAMEMFLVIHFPQNAELPPITGKIIRIERKDDNFHYGCLISGMAPYTRIKLEGYIQKHIQAMEV